MLSAHAEAILGVVGSVGGNRSRGFYRHLHDNGRLIGANDLWIAATGLAHHMPVVTRNVEHFRRVPDLEVESY